MKIFAILHSAPCDNWYIFYRILKIRPLYKFILPPSVMDLKIAHAQFLLKLLTSVAGELPHPNTWGLEKQHVVFSTRDTCPQTRLTLSPGVIAKRLSRLHHETRKMRITNSSSFSFFIDLLAFRENVWRHIWKHFRKNIFIRWSEESSGITSNVNKHFGSPLGIFHSIGFSAFPEYQRYLFFKQM